MDAPFDKIDAHISQLGARHRVRQLHLGTEVTCLRGLATLKEIQNSNQSSKNHLK